MLILAVSDLHGAIAWLPEALERTAPDLLLCAGDWGDPGEVAEADLRALVARVRVLTITGNHDDRQLLERLINLDGTPVLLAQGEARPVGDLIIAGISGIWAKTRLGARLNARWESARRRNPSLSFAEWAAGRVLPPYVTDEDLALLASRLAKHPVDILVTHGCPLGLADRTPGDHRGGQRSFREVFDTVRPQLYLCGHLHRQQRMNLPGGRVVLNAGHGAERQGWLIRRDAARWGIAPLEI